MSAADHPIVPHLSQVIRTRMLERGVPTFVLTQRIRSGPYQCEMDAIVHDLYGSSLRPSYSEIGYAIGRTAHNSIREMVRRHRERLEKQTAPPVTAAPIAPAKDEAMTKQSHEAELLDRILDRWSTYRTLDVEDGLPPLDLFDAVEEAARLVLREKYYMLPSDKGPPISSMERIPRKLTDIPGGILAFLDTKPGRRATAYEICAHFDAVSSWRDTCRVLTDMFKVARLTRIGDQWAIPGGKA